MATEFDAARDATRRTRLANERTYLAWWRTGLTTLAVSLAAGRLVPELSGGSRWPFEAIGIAFAIVGVAFMAYGYLRHREVDDALSRGVVHGAPESGGCPLHSRRRAAGAGDHLARPASRDLSGARVRRSRADQRRIRTDTAEITARVTTSGRTGA